MKICIVQPNGSVAELLMTKQSPTLDDLNNKLLFFENYSYKLVIRATEAIENIDLFIGDYSVPLHYNSVSDCFETETSLIFGGCFDLAYISIYTEDREGNEKFFYSNFLRIATTKQTAIQIEQMLGEIEENIPNFLEICFSRNKKNAGLIKNNIRSIWNTLKKADEIINVYEENLGYFSNHKKSSVESVAAIVDSKLMRTINQESLRWITCNPDHLIKINLDSGFVVNGHNLIPLKVKTYLSQYSYDVYENKVILGFLHSVIEYLNNQVANFKKEVNDLTAVPESVVLQLPNTHELTSRCVYIYYKGIIERFNEKKFRLQEIYYKYEQLLKCTPTSIYATPKLTNTFKQVYHYRVCYESMVQWFEFGDYTFDHLNYLFKLKTLTRIFEYYCLIRIQTALTKCGFTFQNANRIIYDIENDSEEINNEYLFSGNGYELTLLYEPFIWVNKTNTGVNLYSTGYNFSKNKWSERWTPDFILKISSNYREYYYVLDAKYSNARNIKKFYMPDLVLKYSTQIASKDKFTSDIIGVGAIYPGDEDKIYYFKKNVINSKKQSLPIYFSLTVLNEDNGAFKLQEKFQELLNLVDALEEEKETIEIPKERIENVTVPIEKNNSSVNNGKKYEDNILDDRNENNSIEIYSTRRSSDEDTIDNLVLNVSGKHCFYYAKNLCMHKKSRCHIVDGQCALYISKKSKELLLEEHTCRNFVWYVKRGKVKKVECAVSGLPGCVGPNNCGFCMKKNKKEY